MSDPTTTTEPADEPVDPDLATCDECGATAEGGWGDAPTCLQCTPADLVCTEHQRTLGLPGECPLCEQERTAVLLALTSKQRDAAELVAANPDQDVDLLLDDVGVRGGDEKRAAFLLRLLRTGVVRLKVDTDYRHDFGD